MKFNFKTAALCLAAIILAGCDNAMAPAPMVLQNSADFSERESLDEAPQAMRKTAPGEPNSEGADPAGVYLAYRYTYGLIMPATAVKSTSDKHIQICRDAGASKCQISGSSTNSYSDEDVRANLSLRAEPKWLETFVTGIKTDMSDVDGRIENANTSVEDLTRALLDTDARLKAKTTLRTRLEKLLETRDAKLPDLLALERELARVQAEIESATANLKALRARVSMSVVNINYTSERAAVSRSAVSPIGEALKDFVRIVSNGIAGVITFVAFMLPWMIFLIIPGLFTLRWVWRRRRPAELNKG
jgi:hypothetical protein